nr:immunoglobulin heavy chain junction region [Mus musculus]MBK4186174.1 immunoglobulin heavy chain junction region [Mus musculus]
CASKAHYGNYWYFDVW